MLLPGLRLQPVASQQRARVKYCNFVDLDAIWMHAPTTDHFSPILTPPPPPPTMFKPWGEECSIVLSMSLFTVQLFPHTHPSWSHHTPVHHYLIQICHLPIPFHHGDYHPSHAVPLHHYLVCALAVCSQFRV